MTNNRHSQALSPGSIQIPHLMIERGLHQKFGHPCVERKWFGLDADDVAIIKSLGGEA